MHIVWRRLDVEGSDHCSLERTKRGWQLRGASVYGHEGEPVIVSYLVNCDAEWRTTDAFVTGAVGSRNVDYRILRQDGVWSFWEREVPGLGDCVDLDLGFTPSTNTFQLRRLALHVGEAAEVPVAWFDVATGALERLEQRYERRGPREYRYTAPRFSYDAVVQTNDDGFVVRYPGLWEEDTRPFWKVR